MCLAAYWNRWMTLSDDRFSQRDTLKLNHRFNLSYRKTNPNNLRVWYVFPAHTRDAIWWCRRSLPCECRDDAGCGRKILVDTFLERKSEPTQS